MRALLLLLAGVGCGSNDGAASDGAAPSSDAASIHETGSIPHPDGGLVGDPGDASFEDANDPVPANTNVMFVTSNEYPTNFGGLAGADKICSDVAKSVGRKGTFVAWLSTSTVDAKTRLGNARGWVRSDGLPFADTQSDLAAGHVFYPPQVDEYGEVSFDWYVRAATGTLGDGTRSTDTCSDWTSTSQNVKTTIGSGSAGGHAWTDLWMEGVETAWPCTGPLHLYCFQIDHQTPVSVTPPKNARLAFVSSTTIPIIGGLAAGDAACAKDAAAAKLPGSYKALMGTTKASPISRFDTKGAPWARVDGVELQLAYLAAAFDLRADGSVFTGDVFVGAPDDLGNTGSYSCNDWTSTDPNDAVTIGMADWTYGYLFLGIGCDSGPRPVFCLQE